MNDIEAWIREHGDRLEVIARESRLPLHLVHLAAELVLDGLSDEEVYVVLADRIISMDGRHNPLAGAPEALGKIRLLAASS